MSTIMTFNADEILIKDKALKDYLNDLGCLDNNLPIGVPIPYSGNGDIPVGFLLCNGASVLRAAYPDLFGVIGTLYGAIDDEHFNLPNLNGRFIEGSETAGTVKEAGLPNITGDIHSNRYGLYGTQSDSTSYTTGAYSLSDPYTWRAMVENAGTSYLTLSFDASKANGIYGNSDTVQPPSVTMRWIIKAFKGASIDSTDLEITQVANEVAEKANMDLSNLSEVGRKHFFPSNTYINISAAINTVFNYTAPANGFIVIRVAGDGTNMGNISIDNAINSFSAHDNALSYTGRADCNIPCRKNDILRIQTSGGSITLCRFYYAEGEV